MPITHRAIKKLRHDRKRSKENEEIRKKMKDIVKAMRKGPTPKKLASAYLALDKAVKHNIIHQNRAARLKSRLSKLLKKK